MDYDSLVEDDLVSTSFHRGSCFCAVFLTKKLNGVRQKESYIEISAQIYHPMSLPLLTHQPKRSAAS